MEVGWGYSGVGCLGMWRGYITLEKQVVEGEFSDGFVFTCYLLSSQLALAALE